MCPVGIRSDVQNWHPFQGRRDVTGSVQLHLGRSGGSEGLACLPQLHPNAVHDLPESLAMDRFQDNGCTGPVDGLALSTMGNQYREWSHTQD